MRNKDLIEALLKLPLDAEIEVYPYSSNISDPVINIRKTDELMYILE